MTQQRSILPEISLVKGTQQEQQTREQLRGLFARYPLDKWLYTETVQIEEGAIPHSHPILTLHTGHLDDDEQLLGTHIHEQLHWYCLTVEKAEAGMGSINELQERYPALPIAPPKGCGNEFSNYLHVLVNFLEYQGMIELLGKVEARTILEQKTYYTSVYGLVLKDYEQINEVINRFDLQPPALPPAEKIFIDVG